MTSGFVLAPGEGSAYGFHGSAAVIKASGEDTLGQLGVIESVYPAGLSVHEHVHDGEDEMFYLLGGEIEVFCGVDRWTVGAGSFVFVPRDRPHGFTVSTAGPARALVITGPSRLAAQIAERRVPRVQLSAVVITRLGSGEACVTAAPQRSLKPLVPIS
jgi:quercetin dioxygenase-like cupin family protein